jgi:hypothetical protein
MTKEKLAAVSSEDLVKAVETEQKVETTTPASDPFDVSNLRLDQSFIESAGVKKLLTTVPVRKPHKQEFIRVHPDPLFREAFAVIELKDDREFYVLTPAIARALPGEFEMARLFTTINSQGVLFLWPAKLPGSDGRTIRWHTSATEAAEFAMSNWTRVKANMALGAYEWAVTTASIPEPKWPELSFADLLRIAFKDKYVNTLDHAVLKRILHGV